VRKWTGCQVEVFADDGAVLFDDDDCDVRLREQILIVSYFDDEGPLVFEGRGSDDGSYELWCRGRPRKARLSLSPDQSRFEGAWIEGDERGSWRILLGEVTVLEPPPED
jgi:hypothetical protein